MAGLAASSLAAVALLSLLVGGRLVARRRKAREPQHDGPCWPRRAQTATLAAPTARSPASLPARRPPPPRQLAPRARTLPTVADEVADELAQSEDVDVRLPSLDESEDADVRRV